MVKMRKSMVYRPMIIVVIIMICVVCVVPVSCLLVVIFVSFVVVVRDAVMHQHNAVSEEDQ